MASDLSDSGQIEQDASGIIVLHREDAYDFDNLTVTPFRA
ncbi:DnaB-like helicase C-terminal domain-containing protein [Streptomyces caeruleatus]